MRKVLFLTIILVFYSTSLFALQLAELKTETAGELLLFFEQDELVQPPARKAPVIATVITAKEIRNMGSMNLLELLDILRNVPDDYPSNKRIFLLEERYNF